MVANLSTTNLSKQAFTTYTRNIDSARLEQTNVPNQSPSQNHPRQVQSSTAHQESQKQFDTRQSVAQNIAGAYEDVMQRFKNRTVLYRMMETMGGTGTSGSIAGVYLDTYV